jgi:hypothetical protein
MLLDIFCCSRYKSHSLVSLYVHCISEMNVHSTSLIDTYKNTSKGVLVNRTIHAHFFEHHLIVYNTPSSSCFLVIIIIIMFTFFFESLNRLPFEPDNGFTILITINSYTTELSKRHLPWSSAPPREFSSFSISPP